MNAMGLDMTQIDFAKMGDQELVEAALDERLGFNRAKAIGELARRAVVRTELLELACKAIASHRRIGFHSGPPLGWFGADEIYLSGREEAVRALLQQMDDWEPTEQEDLVRHWAGKRGLVELTKELQETYGWVPRYRFTG